MVGSYLRSDKRMEKRARQLKEADEREQQAMCEGKHPYGSFREAKRIADYGCGEAGRKLGVYKCPRCNAFHIGAQARVYQPDALFQEQRVKTMEELLRDQPGNDPSDVDDDAVETA